MRIEMTDDAIADRVINEIDSRVLNLPLLIGAT
jgi:hypothetical protein